MAPNPQVHWYSPTLVGLHLTDTASVPVSGHIRTCLGSLAGGTTSSRKPTVNAANRLFRRFLNLEHVASVERVYLEHSWLVSDCFCGLPRVLPNRSKSGTNMARNRHRGGLNQVKSNSSGRLPVSLGSATKRHRRLACEPPDLGGRVSRRNDVVYFPLFDDSLR